MFGTAGKQTYYLPANDIRYIFSFVILYFDKVLTKWTHSWQQNKCNWINHLKLVGKMKKKKQTSTKRNFMYERDKCSFIWMQSSCKLRWSEWSRKCRKKKKKKEWTMSDWIGNNGNWTTTSRFTMFTITARMNTMLQTFRIALSVYVCEFSLYFNHDNYFGGCDLFLLFIYIIYLDARIYTHLIPRDNDNKQLKMYAKKKQKNEKKLCDRNYSALNHSV